MGSWRVWFQKRNAITNEWMDCVPVCVYVLYDAYRNTSSASGI